MGAAGPPPGGEASRAACGVHGVANNKADAYSPRSQGLAPRAAGCATCLDIKELLNGSKLRAASSAQFQFNIANGIWTPLANLNFANGMLVLSGNPI